MSRSHVRCCERSRVSKNRVEVRMPKAMSCIASPYFATETGASHVVE